MLFVGIVVACLIAIYTYITSVGEESEYVKYRAFINAIQIKILNFIYKRVAKWLNNWENHETESKYANSLAVKMFLFQFFNSYSSLFYIAFGKRYMETCVNSNCMAELSIQLIFIYFVNFATNIIELGMPVIIRTINLYKERRKL
mmetsp:Transcript_24178/g.4042  ORF Transcript_24178/g.4042 Transcript_24178/m.4042 type:complete len:145 (+) Transcript_24178:1297-1731(+)